MRTDAQRIAYNEARKTPENKARRKAMNAAWYLINKEKQASRNRAWMERLGEDGRKAYYQKRAPEQRQRRRDVAEFIAAEKNKPCCDCGQKFHPCVMDFHHVGEKSFAISEPQGRSIEKIKLEIEKCVILCANCHRMRHLRK